MLAWSANFAVGRRPTALIGIAAILFQAMLFGWHHHDFARTGRLPHPVASADHTGSAPPSDIDGDGCEICQTLHHQAAATPEALFAPVPPPLVPSPAPHDAAFAAGALARAFRARAPPFC